LVSQELHLQRLPWPMPFCRNRQAHTYPALEQRSGFGAFASTAKRGIRICMAFCLKAKG